MQRVYDLFGTIGVNDLLVNYRLSDPQNLMYFNSRRMTSTTAAGNIDPFSFSVSNGGNVPDHFANINDAVDHWTGVAYRSFKDRFADVYRRPIEERPAAFRAAWNDLVANDGYSTRGYMRNKLCYPQTVNDWLETFDAATGLYDQAFVESVLDSLDFDWPNPQQEARPFQNGGIGDWHCIDGGTDHIIHNMLKRITKQPHLSSRVTHIAETDNLGAPMSVRWSGGQKNYSQVICTPPLGCIAAIDLQEANLTFGQKIAVRSLHYDASTKVGLRFERRWWEDPTFMGHGREFTGGQSKTDILIRVCVYPSYGMGVPASERPGVMIASYVEISNSDMRIYLPATSRSTSCTWAQDALRLGSLSQSADPQADADLLETVLENVAELHGLQPEQLPQCLDYHAYSWYHSRHSRGAFALFGPGQFGGDECPGHGEQPPFSMFASMKAPAANGKLRFAGEATSMHHAWVLGSLNSAWRAVYNALADELALRRQLIQLWGIPDEETKIGLGLLQAAQEDGRL
ncbi:Flavin containing amine oxidoreductase [Ceratobasidium sp. AG-Ba]|nr:Flavin containing amine oxidoreductase [Ceratobasidium sp. AG-Ba]